MFKSGYIAIIGRPNVGKSTLLNALLGQKIAAVSAKPQTTRHRILGIKTVPQGQMLFLDTPGMHTPHKSLNEYMMEVARAVLNDADVFLLLIEPLRREDDDEIHRMLAAKKKPIIILINKVDRVEKKSLLPVMETCLKEWSPTAVVPVSALKKNGLDRVESEILKVLPEGPLYFPGDQVTDQTERFLASEIVREKIMEATREEVPYAVAVVIEEFREPPAQGRERGSDSFRPSEPGGGSGVSGEAAPPTRMTRIRAAIIIEKESQKGILIGKGGAMLKKIGTEARLELEELLQTKVYLELFVRVEKEWTKDPKKVQEFAYEG